MEPLFALFPQHRGEVIALAWRASRGDVEAAAGYLLDLDSSGSAQRSAIAAATPGRPTAASLLRPGRGRDDQLGESAPRGKQPEPKLSPVGLGWSKETPGCDECPICFMYFHAGQARLDRCPPGRLLSLPPSLSINPTA